jgi:hypothetical protein
LLPATNTATNATTAARGERRHPAGPIVKQNPSPIELSPQRRTLTTAPNVWLDDRIRSTVVAEPKARLPLRAGSSNRARPERELPQCHESGTPSEV